MEVKERDRDDSCFVEAHECKFGGFRVDFQLMELLVVECTEIVDAVSKEEGVGSVDFS